MSNICNHKDCELEKYSSYDECILHCDKSKFDEEHFKWKSAFYDKLRSYTVNYLLRDADEESKKAKKWLLLRYFNHDNKFKEDPPVENIQTKIKVKTDLILKDIKFPDSYDNDYPDSMKIFGSMDSVEFDHCEIFFSNIYRKENDSTIFKFRYCTFKNKWDIGPSKYFIPKTETIYTACIFKKVVNIDYYLIKDKNTRSNRIQNKLFNDCNFNSLLYLGSYIFSDLVFFNFHREKCKIHQLMIKDCIFEKDFALKGYRIDRLQIEYSSFQKLFELKECEINQFEIRKNSKFNEYTNFNKSIFKIFKFENSKFIDTVSFDECKFGLNTKLTKLKAGQNIENYITKFQYVSFSGIVNFRNSRYFQGLELDKVTSNEYMDFLNSNVGFEYTDRDTFRRIKYSFDQIGNHIEANKFFKYEMDKYREELSKQEGRRAEKFVFWFNSYTSDFGQDYTKPIKLIGWVTIPYSIMFFLQKFDCLYKIYEPINPILNGISESINDVAKFSPLSFTLIQGMEFISLIYNLIFVILTYQLIVSLKRHSKR